MFSIKVVQLFHMKALVFEKIEFQKRLVRLSNFTVAAILNNCDVRGCPILLTQTAFVLEQ